MFIMDESKKTVLALIVPFTSLIIPLALQKQKNQHDNSKPVINMAEETYGVRQGDPCREIQ